MAVRKILTYPDPILRERTLPVDVELSSLRREIDDMHDTLAVEKNGAALAANQIGIKLQMFVVAPKLSAFYGIPPVVVNPRIIRTGKITWTEEEGCLSFPGMKIPVTRPRKIDVEFTSTSSPNLTKACLTGFISRVFQHEIDHLSGVLFIDRDGEKK